MKVDRHRALPAALFLLSVLWQLPLLLRPAGIYDEGLVLAGAQRILFGEVPYRDFWNTHAPGQIAVLAAIFKVLGPSIMVERAYDALVRAGVAVAVFALARRVGAPAAALVVWAAATVLLGSLPNYGYVTFPSLLCALAALLLVTGEAAAAVSSGGRPRRLLLAGIASGAGILFRHDLGLVAVVSCLLALWLRPPAGQDGGGAPRQVLLERLGAPVRYLAGVVAVAAPVGLFFVFAGTPWQRLKEIFFTYPFLVYPAFRGLPAPAGIGERVAAAIPAVLVGIALVAGLRLARRPGSEGARGRTLASLGALGVLSLPYAYTRIGAAQQLPVAVPALAVLPGLIAPLARAGRARRTAAVLAVAAALAALLASPLAVAVGQLRELAKGGAPRAAHGIARARWVPLRHGQVAAVNALRSIGAPGDPVYVGLGRHDKALVNDALFYFLADRRCGTYYHNLLPGLVTTGWVQREILADLERRPAMPLVLYSGADEAAEPNASARSSGVTLLDRAIRAEYRLTWTAPPYELWRRKSRGASGAESAYAPPP